MRASPCLVRGGYGELGRFARVEGVHKSLNRRGMMLYL